jgi:hypothetical protein
MKTIEIIALHKEGYEESRRDFDTQKDARLWVKESGLVASYWNRRYERDEDYDGAARDNIHTLQLHINGELQTEWFPRFN